MADEKYTFEQARVRLEEIAVEVRKKDTSLERSLDLLEEGVRLANICTELVDHADFDDTVTSPVAAGDETGGSAVDDRVTPSTDPGDDAEGMYEGAVEASGEGVADTTAGAEASEAVIDEGFDESDDELEEPADAIGDD